MIGDKRKNEIEALASSLRKRFGIANVSAPDMVGVLDKVQQVVPGFRVELRRDSEMPNAEALADVPGRCLSIPCGVYTDLQKGYPRARFTVAHEIGHFILGHSGYTARSSERQKMYRDAKSRLQEKEADYFAATFLAPSPLVEKFNGPAALAEIMQVSDAMARRRLDEVAAEARRRTGQTRRLPPGVADFLAECRKRGMKLQSKLDDEIDS